MSRLAKWSVVVALFALPLLSLAAQSAAQPAAEVEVSQVDWETVGPVVRFHVQFHNPDQNATSGPVTGQMSSQPFGAFVPNFGPIGSFEVPPLAPDSFFDVFFELPAVQLPPSAATILPGGGPGATAPGVTRLAQVCPPPTFWNGNVDIFWTPPGTGSVNYHFGQLLICPGAGNSYVHVIMDCQDPAGISWSFSGLCPGWNVALVSDNGSFAPGAPAPNPIPPGFFDGWICISADPSITTGSVCNPALNLSCGNEPATINVSAEACDWSAVPVEPSTWGKMKSHYGPQADGD